MYESGVVFCSKLALLSAWNTVKIFRQIAPTLEEYIPLDEEVDSPPAMRLGDV